MAGMSDEDAFDAFAAGLDLRQSAGRVRSPYLVLAGEDDELSPIECTYQLFDQVKTPKQLVVYQGERHAIGGPAGGFGPNWMTLLADWLRDRADRKPMTSAKWYVEATGRVQVTLL